MRHDKPAAHRNFIPHSAFRIPHSEQFVIWMMVVVASLAWCGPIRAQGTLARYDAPLVEVFSGWRYDESSTANPFFDSQTNQLFDPKMRSTESSEGPEGGERERNRNRSADEIETDRDSFTPATTVVGQGKTVIESAYSYVDHRGLKPTNSVPELMVRYGLTERVELRLGWNYEVGGAGDPSTGADASDPDPTRSKQSIIRDYTLAYGFKYQVTYHDGWIPGTILIVQGFTPIGGSTGSSPATQLIATYAAGWELPNKWHFDTSIRYGTAEESGDHFSQWSPSAVLRVPLGEKWAVHCEYFAIVTSGKADNTTENFISPGIHYLVNENLEVGVRVGWGLGYQTDRFFSNVGFGWRF